MILTEETKKNLPIITEEELKEIMLPTEKLIEIALNDFDEQLKIDEENGLKLVTCMKFINEEDLTEDNFKKAWDEIIDIREDYKRKKRQLNESSVPQFKSVEEAREYFGSTPFSEWENKMFEKYGMNG